MVSIGRTGSPEWVKSLRADLGLTQTALADSGNGGTGTRDLPRSWRLGTKPNLKQMHSQALNRVPPDLVEKTLRDMISKEQRLTAGSNQAGVRVHNLTQRPRDVDDDGEFHYVILGPSAASEPGEPSSEAADGIWKSPPV